MVKNLINLIVLPILMNFTKHLVKIGLKIVKNSFSSLKLQNSRLGEAGDGGGLLPDMDSAGMCLAKAPNFSALTTLLF